MPCLLLKEEALVKTTRFKTPKYVGDAINTVRIFNQMEVDELIFLDISASLEKRRPNFNLLKDIADECFMPFSYGGGVRTIKDIHEILKIGVEKVVINSYALENPEFIRNSADQFGSQSIVVSIDVKRNFWGKYEIRGNSGKNKIPVDITNYVQQIEKLGAGEIMINSIDRDGTWAGYDIELLKIITSITEVPIVACGGAGKLQDFEKAVKEGGVSAVAAGSLFVYQGKDLGVLINSPDPKELEKLLA